MTWTADPTRTPLPFAPDRVDRLGRANARYDKCRRCGHERDVPLENWDNPSPPFVGG
jgi:hypothetical protein